MPFAQTSCTDRQMHIHATIHTVAQDTLHSAKFQPCMPSQSKVILTHVNSTDPLVGLKCIPEISHISYHKYTPYICANKTLPKNTD